MRKTQGVMDSKMQQAHDWLQDPQALHGGVGEKSVRQVNREKTTLFYYHFWPKICKYQVFFIS